MVLATVAMPKDKIHLLEELGVKDSKLLSPKRREEMYPKIKALASHVEIAIVNAAEIDMRRGIGTNLNQIEALKIAEMLAKIQPAEAYIDSPHSGDPQRFEAVIRSMTIEPLAFDFICEHKADVKFPIVAAASIIAKVERDRAVEAIKKTIGFQFGSGYIADEITKSFVENNRAADNFVRKSWQPYKDIMAKEKQTTLGEF